MRALKSAAWDDEAAYIKAAARGSGGGRAVAANIFAILDRIDEYRHNALTHRAISASPITDDQVKKCLIALYTQPAKAFAILLPRVRALCHDYCPYCGRQSPSQIDHSLEKDIYPEFSVFSINLVYVCDKCNRAKRARHSNKQRNFVMPYFDRFLETLVLSCTISKRYNEFGFRLLLPAGLSAADRGLLERHLHTFKISEEFGPWAGRHFVRLVETRSNDLYDTPDLRHWIAKKLQTYETENGVNSPQAILARGLRDDAIALAELDSRARSTLRRKPGV